MTENKAEPASQTAKRSAGQMGSLLMLALVVMVVIFGALALDVAHFVQARKELQVAVDAGALAGAVHLTNEDTTQAEQEAFTVTAANRADGVSVSNSSPGVRVLVQVVPSPPTQPEDGTCTVMAEKVVSHALSPIFGRHSDRASASATASGRGGIIRLGGGQAFPLAISIDTTPDKEVEGRENVKPLKDLHLGDTMMIDIGSQKVKNAAFTSFSESSANANYINSAIDEALGLTPKQDVVVPPIAVGDSINLNNGIVGQKTLASGERLAALQSAPFFVMPVIVGDPPMNQSAKIIGFVGIQVLNVTTGKKGIVETIVGKIVKPVVVGVPGDPPPDVPGQYREIVTEIAPLSVHLID